MAGYVNIHPLDVKEKLDKGESIILIDVREDEEVAEGIIPGAKHIRLSEIPERISEIGKDLETIMVCRSGGRSSNASQYLASQGFTNIKNMMGGMNAWQWNVE